VILSVFVVLFLTDVKFHLIPDKIIYPAIIFALLFICLLAFVDLKIYHDKLAADAFGAYLLKTGFWHTRFIDVLKHLAVTIASSFLISLFFLVLILVTKGRGMGGGDVKLGFLIGLFNSFPGNVLAVFLGFLFGSIYSIVLIALNKKGVKDIIAFGPFLILGSLVAFIWGQEILIWYLSIF
jgi:leader peptidase (prepilin peptidase) / N-methyltransferase